MKSPILTNIPTKKPYPALLGITEKSNSMPVTITTEEIPKKAYKEKTENGKLQLKNTDCRIAIKTAIQRIILLKINTLLIKLLFCIIFIRHFNNLSNNRIGRTKNSKQS